MRINWVKWGSLLFVTMLLFVLAWWSDAYLTMRRMSLGEPDPTLFIIIGLWLLVVPIWAYYQKERQAGPVLVTLSKRLALQNTDPFAIVKPPEGWVESVRKAAEVAGIDIKYPDMMAGEWVIYIGEGVQQLRLLGKGETTCAIFPEALLDVRGDHVECMGRDKAYIGLEHMELPAWVLPALQANVPGFRVFATEVVYADQPHDEAVLAWDLDEKRERWTRAYSDPGIDYGGRLDYLSDIVNKKSTDLATIQGIVTEELERRRKQKEKVLPPMPEEQEGQNGGNNDVRG